MTYDSKGFHGTLKILPEDPTGTFAFTIAKHPILDVKHALVNGVPFNVKRVVVEPDPSKEFTVSMELEDTAGLVECSVCGGLMAWSNGLYTCSTCKAKLRDETNPNR